MICSTFNFLISQQKKTLPCVREQKMWSLFTVGWFLVNGRMFPSFRSPDHRIKLVHHHSPGLRLSFGNYKHDEIFWAEEIEWFNLAFFDCLYRSLNTNPLLSLWKFMSRGTRTECALKRRLTKDEVDWVIHASNHTPKDLLNLTKHSSAWIKFPPSRESDGE
jgi:hypothetical protein